MGSEGVGPRDATLPPPPSIKEGDGTMSFGKQRWGISWCRPAVPDGSWLYKLEVNTVGTSIPRPDWASLSVAGMEDAEAPFREGCATGSHPVSLGYQPWAPSKCPRLQWGCVIGR